MITTIAAGFSLAMVRGMSESLEMVMAMVPLYERPMGIRRLLSVSGEAMFQTLPQAFANESWYLRATVFEQTQ